MLYLLTLACTGGNPEPPAPDPTAPIHASASQESCGAQDLLEISHIARVAAACTARSGPVIPDPPAFRHPVESGILSRLQPHHRGRDSFYAVGEPQWVLGKFSYGPNDKDLEDEPVDIYLLRGCQGEWEKIGTVATTSDQQHVPEEGVEDTQGRVFFEIQPPLPVGRHRVQMVVQGDHSVADQYIEVLPKGAGIFVTDMDGTLTERKAGDPSATCDEESDFPALWRGLGEGSPQPNVHVGVAPVFQNLVEAGYRPLYLTARPEWLAPHSRNFLWEANRGDGRGDLPPGIVHTTLTLTGAINTAAEAFKKEEMEMLRRKGFVVHWAFGNRPSDVATYQSFQVPYRYYYENADSGGRHCSKITDVTLLENTLAPVPGDWRIRSYEQLLPLVALAKPPCGLAK